MDNNIQVFDKNITRRNRERSSKHLDKHGFLFDWAQKEIENRLSIVKREFKQCLQIGARAPRLSTHDVTLLDSTPSLNVDLVADEEFLPVAQRSQDLIISPLSLHSVNDLPGALIQIKNALKADGLFMAALLGGETLYQLREAMQQTELNCFGGMSARISPFADMQQMGALMQRAGFALPVVDSEKIQVSYENVTKLMHDLRYMGEANALVNRSQRPLTKNYLDKLNKYYETHFTGDDGRLEATFEVIFISGWSPHDSQQKPLRPGSAEKRLSDALQSEEEILPC